MPTLAAPSGAGFRGWWRGSRRARWRRASWRRRGPGRAGGDVFEQQQAFAFQVVDVERSGVSEPVLAPGTASRNGSSNSTSACNWSSCSGKASRARIEAARPSRRRASSVSVFSSVSSSRRGKRVRRPGTTCGNRYGPSVGKIPSLRLPDSGSSCGARSRGSARPRQAHAAHASQSRVRPRSAVSCAGFVPPAPRRVRPRAS